MPDSTYSLTQKAMSKLFNANTIGSILFSAFIVGATYSALIKDVKANGHNDSAIILRQQKFDDAIKLISVRQAVLVNEVENINDKLDDQKHQITRILDILERR